MCKIQDGKSRFCFVCDFVAILLAISSMPSLCKLQLTQDFLNMEFAFKYGMWGLLGHE